jgi:hypothetical protein
LTGVAIAAELVIAKTTIKQIKFLKLIILEAIVFSPLIQKVANFFSKPLTVVFRFFSPFVPSRPNREGLNNKKTAVPAKGTAAYNQTTTH